jgi:hypothetical protein
VLRAALTEVWGTGSRSGADEADAQFGVSRGEDKQGLGQK